MPTWPLVDTSRMVTVGTSAGSSTGTTITAGSANAKGSWTQLVASSAFQADELIVQIGNNSGANADYLVDIGVGAGGSEQVILSNLTVSAGSASAIRTNYPAIPIAIPAGSRIAARCQSSSNAATLAVQLTLIQYGLNRSTGLSRCTTYGADTSDSGGVSIDPGGSANTKGSWTEITSSTSVLHQGLMIGIGNQANNARTVASLLLDIGIGAGGSEQVVVADYILKADANGDFVAPCLGPVLPLTIPAGTRLAARAATHITDATDRLFDVILYGIG